MQHKFMKSKPIKSIPNYSTNITNGLIFRYKPGISNVSSKTYPIRFFSIEYWAYVVIYSFPQCHKLHQYQTTMSHKDFFAGRRLYGKEVY